MRQPAHKLGYPSHTPGLVSGGDSSRAFDDMCAACDTATALGIDSIVNSLNQPEQAAINRRYLNVRYPFDDYTTTLQTALTNIERIAIKRGLL